MEEEKEIKEEKREIVSENNQQDLKPKNNMKGIVTILVIVIVLLVGVLVYVLFFTGDKKEPKEKDEPIVTPVPSDEEEPTSTPVPQEKEEGSYDLTVYIFGDDSWGQIFGEYTEDAKKLVIKVKSANAKFITGEEDGKTNFFLYNDNGIKLYDIKNKKSTSIDIGTDYKEYFINTSKDGKSVIGISYNNKNHLGTFYNLKTKKEMYKNKYEMPEYKSYTVVNDKYIYAITESMSYLLSTESEKVIKSTKNDPQSDFGHIYNSFGSNDIFVYTLEMCYEDGCTIEKIYDNQMKEIFSGNIDEEVDFYVYNNFMYLNDNNKAKKYSMSGELLATKDFGGEIAQIIRNYAVYVKNKKVILENIDDASEKKEISSITEDDDINVYDSGYYTRSDLDNMREKNKKEGLYIIIEYPDKDSKGNYGMEYCYTSDKEIIKYPIKEALGGRAKPVLYLYPTKETNVTVKFAKPELLTTTYPKYINSWNVKVSPNGDMKDEDGKYYYALYWDEKRYNEVDFHEGFYVESKDAIKFLEEKLSYIGLNDKERNEFIMYWLPIMEANKKNLVYFELTEERELGNKLIISPKPDSLLRVSIHIKKVNKKVSIKEQKLSTFKRVGFTAIEWGGMTY